jgi:2-C-methyl-D-erythritol 4-phosphate cytidylyltransferase
VVRGGPTRQASTYEGLQRVSAQCDAVFVHDGARPLVMPEDVRAGMKPVRPGHAALLAVRVVDTIKTVSPDSDVVVQTHERSSLWAAQTPQFATLADMRAAHQAGQRQGLDATDDAMLLERAGVQVHVVPGSPENFKVTLPEDRDRAEYVLRARLALQMQAP